MSGDKVVIVSAADLPVLASDPMERLALICAFSPRDAAATEYDAIVYSIACGWGDPGDADEEACLAELREVHGWTVEFTEALKLLHPDLDGKQL